MRVRCGACGGQFEANAPGRYNCPTCGALNQVRAANQAPPTAMTGVAPPAPAPVPPPPEPPSPRVACPECSYSFIVGEIEVATCPNCGTEVSVGTAAGGAT